uniref:Uncharacterized protein LOC114346868 isoform X1 n=1 Tax=Diabrotica virgifera virgifera TaxID=50390 RepID=A0A6P7H4F1_DIAVI
MDLKGRRLLKFYCEDCHSGIKLIPKLLVKIDKLEEEITELKNNIENIKIPSQCPDNEDLINEIMDRQRRASNIIIFNVNESKMKSNQERNNEDNNVVQDILQNFDIDKSKIKSFRVGKFQPEKIRPIKVILPSTENVKMILRNKELIKGPSVKIFSDQTNAQREYLNKLKLELKKMNDSGDNSKTIKFFNNKPTIVDKIHQKN